MMAPPIEYSCTQELIDNRNVIDDVGVPMLSLGFRVLCFVVMYHSGVVRLWSRTVSGAMESYPQA
jgi:hypothetical protein